MTIIFSKTYHGERTEKPSMMKEFFPTLQLLTILLLLPSPVLSTDGINDYGASVIQEEIKLLNEEILEKHHLRERVRRFHETETVPYYLSKSPQSQHNQGSTPLCVAILRGNTRMVELLLEAGADPDLVCRYPDERSCTRG